MNPQIKILSKNYITNQPDSTLAPVFINASKNGYLVKVIANPVSGTGTPGIDLWIDTEISSPAARFDASDAGKFNNKIFDYVSITGGNTLTISDIHVPPFSGLYTQGQSVLVSVYGIEYPAND